MNRISVGLWCCLFAATFGGLATGSCKRDRDRAGAGAQAPTEVARGPSIAATVKQENVVHADVMPPHELARELERRRAAWTRQGPSKEENRMTPERVRRIEMSRFELTSLSQEAAVIEMGLPEGDKLKLRQALAASRDATLVRIEHAGDREPTALLKGGDLPANTYAKQQREILGDVRYREFSRLEQRERSKLIEERRAFRSRR